MHYTRFARALTHACCRPVKARSPKTICSSKQFHQVNQTALQSAQQQELIKQHKYAYSSTPNGHDHRHDKIIHKSKVAQIVQDKKESDVSKPEESKSMGLMQRFKNAYKQYGKTLVAVHVATSIVWFGSFYYAAAR